MLKKLFIISLALLAIVSSVESDSLDFSGLKFGIDTNIFKFLKTVDLNKFAQNKSLIKEGGINIEKSGIVGYKIHLANLTITDIKNPEQVEVFTRQEGNNQYLNIIINNFEINLQSTFDIEVINFFTDNLDNSGIKVVLDRIESEFFFDNQGFVKFNKLDVQIGNIEMNFNSIFFRTIFKIFKRVIINAINDGVSRVYNLLEVAVNNFITSELLIDVGMGIGINATNVDRPVLQVFERSSSRNEAEILSDEKNLRKQKNYNLAFADPTHSTILEFGIHGAVYPNAAPDVHPDIKPASNMEYIQKTFNNELTLLVSDYSVNSLLFMAQQTGALKMLFNNDTNKVLPFNIDTQGLSAAIPEFAIKYPENVPAEIKLYVNPVNHKQPMISTESDGSLITFNFGLDINVYNSTDPWDDPNKELQLNVVAHTKVQYLVSENKLNVICFRGVIEEVGKKFDELNVSQDSLKNALEGIVNALLKSYKPLMTGIDVSGLFENSFGMRVNNLYLLTEDQYSVVSIDLVDA